MDDLIASWETLTPILSARARTGRLLKSYRTIITALANE
jgi:hypothetical protein